MSVGQTFSYHFNRFPHIWDKVASTDVQIDATAVITIIPHLGIRIGGVPQRPVHIENYRVSPAPIYHLDILNLFIRCKTQSHVCQTLHRRNRHAMPQNYFLILPCLNRTFQNHALLHHAAESRTKPISILVGKFDIHSVAFQYDATADKINKQPQIAIRESAIVAHMQFHIVRFFVATWNRIGQFKRQRLRLRPARLVYRTKFAVENAAIRASNSRP